MTAALLWKTRPSTLLGITDRAVAYQLDVALALHTSNEIADERKALEDAQADLLARVTGGRYTPARGSIGPGERYEKRADLSQYPPATPPDRWRKH